MQVRFTATGGKSPVSSLYNNDSLDNYIIFLTVCHDTISICFNLIQGPVIRKQNAKTI